VRVTNFPILRAAVFLIALLAVSCGNPLYEIEPYHDQEKGRVTVVVTDGNAGKHHGYGCHWTNGIGASYDYGERDGGRR
jgi:hypothetical protein